MQNLLRHLQLRKHLLFLQLRLRFLLLLPFLQQQIALVRPSGLLVLGWSAAQALLGQRASLDRLRGQVHRYQDAGLDIPVVVTHHPASLMLRGHFKADAWHDLHLARRTRVP